MDIRLRNIPKFQNGGVPQWYIDRYGNRTSLLRWNNNLDYSAANKNLNLNNHYNAGNLDTVFLKNQTYILDKNAVTGDILTAYNDFGLGMSAEDFVNLYNKNAATIRSHWDTDLTYGEKTAGNHNRLFFRMFRNRSNQNIGDNQATYNIGYLNNLEDIEGSSTWLRRMDLYENEFDFDNPDENRIHEITLSNGKKVRVYKKANGDIGLVDVDTRLHQASKIDNPLAEVSPTANIPEEEIKLRTDLASIISDGEHKFGLDWSKIKEGALKLLNNPDLYSLGRLAYTLHSNDKIYGEAEKAIKPNLIDSYHTDRQVVGDEATKLAYYRRAAEGVTKASRPITSDADKQMAYQMEAQRVANELRAQGDLADNQIIQKTSDESNQHQWANTQRDNLVANANRAALNDYNARLHNLRAQHKSADAASINNFWLEIEYRKRQLLAEDLNFNDLIWQYGLLEKMYQDENLMNAQRKLQEIKKAHTNESGYVDITDPDVINAKKEYDIAYNNFMVRMYRERYNQRRSNSIFVKKGGKVTYKKKDDLLYKSAKDIVEHFRRMTKLAYDSVSKRPKEVKLVSHPKGSTKKYLLGGVAPFLVYTPVALGGETTTTSGGSTSSTKKSSSDDLGQDLLKNLFLLLLASGLPSDVNAIYSRIGNLLLQLEFFGNALSTDDILSIYVSTMQLINTIKFNKALYDKAQELVINRDAGDEAALTADGKVVVLNRETAELNFKKIDEVDGKKESILTNNDLLNIRAYSPSAALNSSLLTITNNATSLNEISKYLKAQLPSIGSSERTVEGYSLKDSNDIKLGIELLAGAPNGLYKISEYSKSLKDLANKALQYLYTILPNNMKNLLAFHTGGQLEALDLIATMINSTLNFNERTNILTITGKTSTSDGSKSSSGTDTPSAVQFLLGNGYLEKVEFNIGNSLSVTALGRFGILLDVNKHNLGQGSTLLDVSTSQFGPILDLDKATFGGSRLISPAYSHIILNNSDCVGVDLPVKKDVSGNYVPDFQLLAIIEKAEEYINNNNITDLQEINKVYTDLGLPKKFDSNGNLIQQNYKRFAAILVILDLKALKGGTPINMNEVLEADESERELFIEIMRNAGNKDYDLSDGILWSTWGKDKLYKGTIFAPVREDIVGGYISGGLPLDYDLPNDANKVAMMQHAPKIQEYKNAPSLSSLK